MAGEVTPRAPLLARVIFKSCARGAARETIIGDLEEEFHARAQTSLIAARRWYWRQAIFSAPHFAAVAMRSAAAQRLALMLVGLFGAYVFMHYWEVIIARGAARGFYSLTGGDYGPARALFMLAVALGAGIAGAAFSRLAAAPHQSRAAFLLTRALPAAALLASPAIVQMLAPADNYPIGFTFAQTVFSVVAFIAGSAIAAPRK